jgi:alkylation response protein AidB-like acyl-CoA dehydrogenase
MTAATEIDDLASTARRFLSAAWSLDIARPPGPVDTGSVRAAWHGAAKLGWSWVAYADRPELALRAAPALAALFRVIGQHPAPVPAASLAVTLPVLAAAAPGRLDAFLDGEQLIAATGEAGWPADDPWSSAAAEDGRLTGELFGVPGAAAADAFVVPAISGGTPCLMLVRADAPGVRVDALRTYDRLEAPARVVFDGAAAEELVLGEQAHRVIETTAVLARVAGAAELGGLADAAVAMAVEYARQRTQFGRVIGSFQAVKHLLAEAAIDVYAAESAALASARRVSAQKDTVPARRDADLAFAFNADAARRAAETALQVHGGIGFTLECQLSWYFNRVLSRSGALGAPRSARLALGRRALGQPAPGQPAPGRAALTVSGAAP